MKSIHLFGFLSVLYLAGCTAKGSTEKEKRLVEVPVFELQSRDTMLHKSYVSSIAASQNVELRAKVSGFLEGVAVDEGQFVQKGQLLFRLNDAEFKLQLAEANAALTSAEADLKSAEVETDRVKRLVDKKILSQSELELANARLAAARAKVQEAEAGREKAALHLSYANIRAPFSGVIDRIPHKIGSLMSEGTLLTTVSDVHLMHAYFNVSESEYLHYVKAGPARNRMGKPVQLQLADGTMFPQTGKIETMDGEIEKQTGSIAFRAQFRNPDKLLKHGASGKVLLTSMVPRAIMIPQRSVFEIQDKNYVFVLENNNTVKMKQFTPDTRIDDFVLVKEGLEPGDRIIYEGIQNIREGVKVAPRFISADSLLTVH
jgi:membrane fusion protein (multidrug efflux system)